MVEKKKIKIFVGLDDVSSSITNMKQLFLELGVQTITAIKKQHSLLDQCDVDYKFSDYPFREFKYVRPTKLKLWLQKRFNMSGKIFRQAVKECDVFIFIWESFEWDMSDYKYLKSQGKKIITIFCGNDIRWHYACKQEFDQAGLQIINLEDDLKSGVALLNQKLKKLRAAEKYSDIIVSRVDQSQLSLRPYFRWHMYVMPDKLKYNPTQRKINPIVAHAPSHRGMKGTKYVLEAFEKLKEEGISFTPLLIENLPNKKMLEKLGDIDILIDQLLIPGTGKIASEGLASGCIVMSLMGYKNYPQKNPENCPIIDVNPNTIYDELKKIILDYEKRVELNKKGLDYVYENLQYKNFCKKLLDIIEGQNIDFDYYPTFFREKFIPESAEALETYNKWTREVQGCDWYQKNVLPGERSKLIF